MRLGKKHPKLRRLRELRRSAAERRGANVFLAEGRHLAGEAIASGAEILQIVIAPSLLDDAEGRALHRALGRAGEVDTVDDGLMETLQEARSPQPVLLVVRRPEPRGARSDKDPGLPDLVLHGLQDPGNLGAVLRSAEAAGVGDVYVTGEAADPYHPRAVRGSMGSIFRVQPLETSWGEVLKRSAARGATLIGFDSHRGEPLYEAPFPERSTLVFGSEGAGLPEEMTRALQRTLRIPMREPVESLSVAAAPAVVLFEFARRRGQTA